jgi:hypothetical protein
MGRGGVFGTVSQNETPDLSDKIRAVFGALFLTTFAEGSGATEEVTHSF